jgi:hypothetical protein
MGDVGLASRFVESVEGLGEVGFAFVLLDVGKGRLEVVS